MLKLLLVSITLMSVGCTRSVKTAESRTPQSVGKLQENVFSGLSDADKKKAEQRVIRKNSDLLSIQLKNFMRTQRMVTEFDQRCQKLVNEYENDEVRAEAYNKLLHSNLYCQIQEQYKVHHEHELRLLYTYYFAIRHSLESRQWFISQLATFANPNGNKNDDNYKRSVAGQLILFFKNFKPLICSPNCNEDLFKNDLQQIAGGTFVEKEYSDFMLNLKKSESYSTGNALSNIKPGSCFDRTAHRAPNSGGSYDWKARNWTGASLPKGQFVITYDDGPHNVFTESIMKTWSDSGMEKPTFFWLTQNIRTNNELVRQAFSKGYTIGSHSNVHADLGTIAKSESGAEMGAVNKRLFPEAAGLTGMEFLRWSNNKLDSEILGAIHELTQVGQSVNSNYRTRLFRLPYGSGVKNPKIGNRLQAAQVDQFFWEVDSLDWQDKNPASIVDRVLTQMKASGRGIILFHDVHQQSFDAAALLIEAVKNSNGAYKFVPLTDLKIQPWPN